MTEQFEGDQPKGCENCGAYNWIEKRCMYGTDANCKAPDWHAWREKDCRSCYFGGYDTDPNTKIAGFEPTRCNIKECENYSKWRSQWIAVPRQPMPGDVACEKPVTPPAKKDNVLDAIQVALDVQPSLSAMMKKVTGIALYKRIIEDIRTTYIDAHNRDMESTRSKIAELELHFNQAKENAETNARLLNEALSRITTFEVENADLHVKIARSNRIIGEIHDTFYGRNMSVVGWHLNGNNEPIDNFFDSNDWSEDV